MVASLVGSLTCHDSRKWPLRARFVFFGVLVSTEIEKLSNGGGSYCIGSRHAWYEYILAFSWDSSNIISSPGVYLYPSLSMYLVLIPDRYKSSHKISTITLSSNSKMLTI